MAKEIFSIKEFERAKRYWQSILSGEIDETRLPTDFHRTADYSGGSFPISLPKALADRLLAFSSGVDLLLYVVLLSAFKILVFKYTQKNDIMTAVPVYSSSGEPYEFNTFIVARVVLYDELSFEDLLVKVKQALIDGFKNQHYRLDSVPGLDAPDFSFTRMMFLLENIHQKALVSDTIHSSANDLTISILRVTGGLEGVIDYNTKLFKRSTIQKISGYYLRVLDRVSLHPGNKLAEIELISEDERKKVLHDFNETAARFPGDKTLNAWFEDQVERTPHNIAVCIPVELGDIYDELESEIAHADLFEKIGACCFQKNPFIFVAEIKPKGGGETIYKLIKTHRHNSVLLNGSLFKLLSLFDGRANAKSLWRFLKDVEIRVALYAGGVEDILEIAVHFNQKQEISLNGRFEDFVTVIKWLYRCHLIELTGFCMETSRLKSLPVDLFGDDAAHRHEVPPQDILMENKKLAEAEVLFLGDTPGMPTTGLLYLASFLYRRGIKTYCRFYDSDWSGEALRENIKGLLNRVKPKIVAISMKWFPHIARVLEMCHTVKEFSNKIKVVLGGNTASYYPGEISQYETVDYVVCGDGEVPLLEICRGNDSIQNCFYKRNGKLIHTPITYKEDETNAAAIFLSNLDDIVISDYSSLFGSFFIYTHKGCEKNCLYCGGCRAAHRKTSGRSTLFRRDARQVRQDIIEAQKYTSTFFFDFDAPNSDLLAYCKRIWGEIDLSSHFCILGNLTPPSPDLIEYSRETFKYVFWNLDVASLSERHRMQLSETGQVKPQPTDREIEAFLAECEKYDNVEVRINLIAGLPYFTPGDIRESERVLAGLMRRFSCLSELHWARLHAQPGAPITGHAGRYNMYSRASTFEDFLEFSRANFQPDSDYSALDYLNYPYIYFKDDDLNSRVSRHYMDTNLKVSQHKEARRRRLVLYESLTYRQLNHRVNQLAAVLRKENVGPNTIAVVMVKRSIEMIVALFGILKAGGAYLPIDVETPGERVRFMLQEAQAAILLTEKTVGCRLPAGAFTGTVICLDEETEGPNSVQNPVRLNSSSDLAYVIYTSGTTGKPKGVLAHHRGVVNYTLWRHKTCEYTGSDITLQPLTYCFDGFGSNLYSSLLSGGKLICIPESKKWDFDYIKKIIKNCRVTNMSLIPLMYEAILDGACKGDLESLRFVVLAGEGAGALLVKRSVESHPHIKLINEYGPTEAAVTAAAKVGMDYRDTTVVGKPIMNSRMFILDGSLGPAPIGLPGEICLGGVGLSWGYLNGPELTAQKFLLSPLEDKQRIYKTGDLGRWLPNGDVEILGRLDHQVKIRGNRVDLTEIERQMIKYDGVKEAVVVSGPPLIGENNVSPLADEGRMNRLYGYWVGNKDIEEAEFRNFLARYLPEYMIPSGFFHLEALPIAVNGKVDRKALALPKTLFSRQYTAPEDPVEEKLVEIWAEILGIDKTKIGVDDNFFELGGHSLKGTVLIARIQQVLSVKFSLGVMFKKPTVRELARHIKGLDKDEFRAIQPAQPREYYALSASQKRLFFHQQIRMADTSYNLVSLVQLEGLLNTERLSAAFEDLIKRHEGLRTSFLIVKNEPVQKIHTEVDFKVDYYEADPLDGGLAEILKKFIRPFDLARPPLLRIGLIKLEDERYTLLVDIHHIIADGISVGILFREFMALYTGEVLPPVTLHYKDFAEWQNSGRVRQEMREQEKYWLGRFEKGVPTLNIIADYQRPGQQSFAGDCVHFELNIEETAALREMAVAAEATLYIVLLTIFNILLFKISGQEDIVVGTGTAGRRHADLQPIIGMFINMLVLRNCPTGEKSFMAFLGEVRERTLSDFENQEYPFDDLVENLAKNRDFSRNPLFQVVFELQNIDVFSGHLPEVSIPGLKATPLDYNRKISRFDICWLAALDNGQLFFTVQHCSKLFKRDTIERYVAYYREIVSAILINPQITLQDISISSGFLPAKLNVPADSFSDFGFSN
jgi:amino acid adenylation domain-containing protein